MIASTKPFLRRPFAVLVALFHSHSSSMSCTPIYACFRELAFKKQMREFLWLSTYHTLAVLANLSFVCNLPCIVSQQIKLYLDMFLVIPYPTSMLPCCLTSEYFPSLSLMWQIFFQYQLMLCYILPLRFSFYI